MFELEDIAEVVGDAVREATQPLIARIAELEKRPASVSVRSAVIDRDGNLVLMNSDGSTTDLGHVVGKDGDHGRNGLTADDVDARILDDGRTVEFSVRQGEHEYSFELAFPVPLYRGVFADGETYVKGDTVTWGGSLWHCSAETVDKPGAGDSWQLAVKKGRDGRDAR